MAKQFEYYNTLRFHEVDEGCYTGFTLSICPSVRPSVRLSVSPSVDEIVSALCPQQYSPNLFHSYTYRATSDVSRVFFCSKIQEF